MKILTGKDGIIYKRGENAIENWNLLDESSEDDIFFHLSKFPSCYVIMKTNEKTLCHDDMYILGAEFCKSGTKYRNLHKLKVDYCTCNNLIKGDNVGQVIFKSKRKVHTLTV